MGIMYIYINGYYILFFDYFSDTIIMLIYVYVYIIYHKLL